MNFQAPQFQTGMPEANDDMLAMLMQLAMNKSQSNRGPAGGLQPQQIMGMFGGGGESSGGGGESSGGGGFGGAMAGAGTGAKLGGMVGGPIGAGIGGIAGGALGYFGGRK